MEIWKDETFDDAINRLLDIAEGKVVEEDK